MRLITVLTACLLAVVVVLSAVGCGSSGTEEKGSEPGGTINEIEQEANDAAREANLRQIDSTIQAYYAENGTYPTDISQLAPYFIRGIPKDPAGGTYYIIVQGGVPKAAVR